MNDGIKLFGKIKSGEIKLEQTRKLHNALKSNLNKISRGRNKSGKQKSALKNIKVLFESWEAVIKLFNGYSLIIFEANYKTIDGKGVPSMLAHLACIAKVSDCKVSDHSNLKILSPKPMLQRLPIAFTQVKAGNIFVLNEITNVIKCTKWNQTDYIFFVLRKRNY